MGKKEKEVKKPEVEKQVPIEKQERKNRRGRPSKKGREENDESKENLQFNSVDCIKNSFLQYLYEIKFPKGLVFDEKKRAILIKEQNERELTIPKINWKASHSWKLADEKEKAEEVIRSTIDAEMEEEACKQLVMKFLDMGQIFPDQITGEIYRILSKVYLMGMRFQQNQVDSFLEEYVPEILNNDDYMFLTARFSSKEDFKRDREFLRPKLFQLFKKLFKHLNQVRNGKQ